MHLYFVLIFILGDLVVVTLSQSRQVQNAPTNATEPSDVSQPSTLLQSSTSLQHTMPNCSKNICKGDEVCRAIGCPCPENYVETAPAGTTGKTCLPVTTVGCPKGWDALAGDTRCYRVFNSRGVDRQGASEQCRREQPGAELAIVPAKAVAAYVIQKIMANTDESTSETLDRKVWMGLMYDRARKNWTWPNGENADSTFGKWKTAYWPTYECTIIILTNNSMEIPFYNALDCLTQYDCEETSTNGFVCDMPRTVRGFEPPLRSFQIFEKICCNNATPILKDEKKDVVSHWILNSESESLSFDKSCQLYYGSFMIDMNALHLIRNNLSSIKSTIECHCPLAGLNDQCHEECDLVKFSYISPSDKSKMRTGRRCACNAPFVGNQCELVCNHGSRTKLRTDRQYACICGSFYKEDDCSEFDWGILTITLCWIAGPIIVLLCCYRCHAKRDKDTEMKNNTDDHDGLQQSNTISQTRIETTDNPNNDPIKHATKVLPETQQDSKLPTYHEALISNTGRKREDSNNDLPAYEDVVKLYRMQPKIAEGSNKSNATNQ